MDMVERIKKLMESPEPEKVDPVVEVKNIKVRKNLPVLPIKVIIS